MAKTTLKKGQRFLAGKDSKVPQDTVVEVAAVDEATDRVIIKFLAQAATLVPEEGAILDRPQEMHLSVSAEEFQNYTKTRKALKPTDPDTDE